LQTRDINVQHKSLREISVDNRHPKRVIGQYLQITRFILTVLRKKISALLKHY